MKKNILFTICLQLFFICCTTQTNANEPELGQTIIYPEDGIYTISTGSNKNMVIEAANYSLLAGANIQIGLATNGTEQHYLIFEHYNGWYQIKNVHSQCNLDVTSANPNPQANLQQYIANDSDAQLFQFIRADEDSVFIKSKLGTYIDLANGNLLPGTNIQLFKFNGDNAQKWSLNIVESQDQSIDLENGEYIIYADMDKKLVCVDTPHKLIGQPIITTDCAQSNSNIFIIKKETDGWYTIKNKDSNLYLESYCQDNIYYLRQWTGTGLDNQKFQFMNAGNNTVYIKSKYELVIQEVTDKDIYTNLTLATSTISQKWYLQNLDELILEN